MHRHLLTEFEQSEVLEYPQVFFVGAAAHKLRGVPGPAGSANNNHGYDDERGDYMSVGHDPRLTHDHLAYRYEVLGLLGKGSFGAVLRCFDHKTQTMRAVKIIRNKKRFHHQALVEVKVLEHLRNNDAAGGDASNLVSMHEYFYFRSHLCIAFELLSINLYEFIKNNNFQGLSLGLIRRFAQQLLVSLRFLRSCRVIHCDLKPENILLKAPNKSGIKVIDFGSSCFEEERVYTYIQSRFYRSPEVILGVAYDMGIDMWSLGCILAELFTGYPLFPGENEAEQLACIMEVMGLPPRHLVDGASRRRQFFDSAGQPRIVANSRGKRRRPGTRDLATALHCSDAGFVSFLHGCLRWDPRERLSPEAALAHEWVRDGAASFSGPVGAAPPRGAYTQPPPVSSSRPPPQLPPQPMTARAAGPQQPQQIAPPVPYRQVQPPAASLPPPPASSNGSLTSRGVGRAAPPQAQMSATGAGVGGGGGYYGNAQPPNGGGGASGYGSGASAYASAGHASGAMTDRSHAARGGVPAASWSQQQGHGQPQQQAPDAMSSFLAPITGPGSLLGGMALPDVRGLFPPLAPLPQGTKSSRRC